jgi:hypothetical protein
LNDADTLPQAFADSVDRKDRVLNLGFSGYGPQQFLSELRSGNFDSVIGPQPKLFVFLTSAAHAERSACKPFWGRRGPRYVIENGQPVLKGACYEGLSLWLLERFHDSAPYRWLIEPYQRRMNHDDKRACAEVRAINAAGKGTGRIHVIGGLPPLLGSTMVPQALAAMT